MQPEIPLRERKKVRTKLAIFKTAITMIGQSDFRTVLVDDICRQTEVSKVTFFKCFPKKEDLLAFYMRVWLTERMIELSIEPRRGLAAVRHLFQDVAKRALEQPGIMPSLIAMQAEMRMHPCVPTLSETEIALLFPGHEDVAAQNHNLFELFRQWMQEAEEDGELGRPLPDLLAVQMLFTIFYGGFLTASLFSVEDIMSVYESQLHLLVTAD